MPQLYFPPTPTWEPKLAHIKALTTASARLQAGFTTLLVVYVNRDDSDPAPWRCGRYTSIKSRTSYSSRSYLSNGLWKRSCGRSWNCSTGFNRRPCLLYKKQVRISWSACSRRLTTSQSTPSGRRSCLGTFICGIACVTLVHWLTFSETRTHTPHYIYNNVL